ncbi:MAG: hypothetical protein HEEMFOPI_01505 [Holosporales bacterium]
MSNKTSTLLLIAFSFVAMSSNFGFAKGNQYQKPRTTLNESTESTQLHEEVES